ncbi:hypothetical protein J3459_010535 [Metarhizium acridum]|nr:hypothetical protein J3459_010535 [Metarhizium acridum]
MNTDMCLTQGPDMVKAVFKNSWTCTMAALHRFVLGNVFGMSGEALRLYDLDKSGYRHKPVAGTAIEPRNRIDYLTYGPMIKFLSGPGMKAFWNRYETHLTQKLQHLPVGAGWTEMPDLTRVFEVEVSAANTDALCGPYLLQRHPDFSRSCGSWIAIWIVSSGAPRAYSHPGRVFRERHGLFSEMDHMDSDAMASEDFGVIWASTRNSVVASLWAVLEIISDSEILRNVRREVAKCRDSSPTGLNITLLLESPLLQSIYAEVLRLRVHMLIIRVPIFDNLHVKDWMVPRGDVLLMSTTVAHMDPAVWNTGENGQHPLDTFWAERFLKYDGVPGSGPRRTASNEAGSSCPARSVGGGPPACPAPRGNVSYGIKDVDGAWIPYGGGQRQCPGRHFAKRDIIYTAAVMVTYFDIEPLVDVDSLKMDMRGFGLGTMAVKGAIPFRIRRREILS